VFISYCHNQQSDELVAFRNRCRCMGWCLSTGMTWIFGVVCTESDLSGDVIYTIYSMEPMTLDVGTDKLKHNVSFVFWALMYYLGEWHAGNSPALGLASDLTI